MNCGNNIEDGAKFCRYCGKRTTIASKDSMTEETVPNYQGAEYTVVYSSDGQGGSRVRKLSDGLGYQSDVRAVDEQAGIEYDASVTRPAHGGMGGYAADLYGNTAASPQAGVFAPGSGEENPENSMSSSYNDGMYNSSGQDQENAARPPLSAQYTSKAFNSPVLDVAGLKEGEPNPEHSEKYSKKGNRILIFIIVILILLILLVGFSAFAYIQGLIDF